MADKIIGACVAVIMVIAILALGKTFHGAFQNDADFARIEEMAHVYAYKCPNAGFKEEVIRVQIENLGVYPGVVVHKDGDTFFGYCLTEEGRWYLFYHDLSSADLASAKRVSPGSVPEPVYINLMDSVYGARIAEKGE